MYVFISLVVIFNTNALFLSPSLVETIKQSTTYIIIEMMKGKQVKRTKELIITGHGWPSVDQPASDFTATISELGKGTKTLLGMKL